MNKALLPFLCVINFCCLLSPVLAFGGAAFGGTPYCSVPPVPGAGVKPNVLLMLDNSLSMTDLAYDRGKHCTPTTPTPCSSDSGCATAAGEICRDKVCTSTTPTPCSTGDDCKVAGQSCTPDSHPFYCVDDSYRDDNAYPGYFDRNSIYRYDSGKFVVDAAYPLSVVSSCTGSCAASTAYLSVQMSGTAPTRAVQTFKASGNFLNWLTMSKMDLEKLALTGGKLDTDGALLAESRGCLGKRFVKLVPDAPGITFTVRGGNAVPGDYIFEWAPGPPGATYIELYDRSYRKTSCLTAVNDWESAVTGPVVNPWLQVHAEDCMGVPMTDGTTWKDAKGIPHDVPTQARVYLDIRSACYGNGGTIGSSFKIGCAARTNTLGHTPAGSIKLHDGDDACGTNIAHPVTDHNGESDTLGFVMRGWVSSTTFTDVANLEARDYCTILSLPLPVDDPSISSTRSGAISTIPPFIVDAGIYGLGAPAQTFQAKVAVAAPPTGLIQEFGSDISFGAMIFNDGTADGGKVIAAVGSPLGTHHDLDSGVIYSIDHLTTSSRSPHSGVLL
jgi:type IV pilus assembly protein PilY1